MPLLTMVIDALDFARREGRVSGQVKVVDLLRLTGLLERSDGSLECLLVGGRKAGSTRDFELRVSIRGELELKCQRCLQALRFTLNLDRRLQLVVPGAPWPDEDVEDEQVDAIEASRELVVGTLIEDEALLALPLSPRHEICVNPVMSELKRGASPFSVLRELKID